MWKAVVLQCDFLVSGVGGVLLLIATAELLVDVVTNCCTAVFVHLIMKCIIVAVPSNILTMF